MAPPSTLPLGLSLVNPDAHRMCIVNGVLYATYHLAFYDWIRSSMTCPSHLHHDALLPREMRTAYVHGIRRGTGVAKPAVSSGVVAAVGLRIGRTTVGGRARVRGPAADEVLYRSNDGRAIARAAVLCGRRHHHCGRDTLAVLAGHDVDAVQQSTSVVAFSRLPLSALRV